MSLIKCPECKREISDKAIACPHCGYPISNNKNISKTYTVRLEKCGANKVQVIKCIRIIKGADLLDAKNMADSAPVIFDYDLSLEQAMDIKNQLEQAGATVSIPEYNESDAMAQQTTLNQVHCPRCGSTQVVTGQRGFSFLTGFLGSNKTVNRCAKCSYKWEPRK